MNREELERAIHDYLDGRMPERERASFQARREQDVELAERLEFHRSVGRALRSPVEGPRPGFARRARARFESADRRRAGWGSLLRWEAAGMVAAGVLLALLVLPSRREGVPASGVSQPSESEALQSAYDRAEPAPRPPDSAAIGTEKKESSQTPTYAPAPAAAVAKEAVGASAPLAEVGQERGDQPTDDRAAGAASVEESAQGQLASRMKSLADAASTHRAVRLPEGSVSAGSVERLPAIDLDASKDVNDTTRFALSELRPIRGQEDVLLIGPRASPVSCDGYRIEMTAQTLRILLPSPAPGLPESPSGCAIIVPASSLPVVVEDPIDAGR